MDTQAVREKVIQIICEKLADANKDKITDATRYVEDLHTDSLDQADLVMEFEDEFEIDIPDEEEGKIRTVGETVKFIEELLKKKGDGPKEKSDAAG